MNATVDPKLLDEIEAAAQRHLDGTRVNTDRLASNALLLVKAVRAAEILRRQGAAP